MRDQSERKIDRDERKAPCRLLGSRARARSDSGRPYQPAKRGRRLAKGGQGNGGRAHRRKTS